MIGKQSEVSIEDNYTLRDKCNGDIKKTKRLLKRRITGEPIE